MSQEENRVLLVQHTSAGFYFSGPDGARWATFFTSGEEICAECGKVISRGYARWPMKTDQKPRTRYYCSAHVRPVYLPPERKRKTQCE